MLSRPLPSIDHFLFTPKKYLPLLFSTTSFGTRGPVYSMIFLPLGMRCVANSPRPVAERLISYGGSVCFMCEKWLTPVPKILSAINVNVAGAGSSPTVRGGLVTSPRKEPFLTVGLLPRDAQSPDARLEKNHSHAYNRLVSSAPHYTEEHILTYPIEYIAGIDLYNA